MRIVSISEWTHHSSCVGSEWAVSILRLLHAACIVRLEERRELLFKWGKSCILVYSYT